MIKKILSTLLVSSTLLVFSGLNSMAERPTVAIGAALQYGGYSASGQEIEGSSGVTREGYNTETHKRNEAMEVGYSSVFLEVSMRDRLTIGVEYMGESVETDTESRTDSAAPGSVKSEADTGTSSVKVEISDKVTAYPELRLIGGMYAKIATMSIDIETKENLHTSSSYGNMTLDGMGYGFGWINSWDNGVFLKTDMMIHDWDDFQMSATSADATPNGNQIKGNLDGAIASFRLGKAF